MLKSLMVMTMMIKLSQAARRCSLLELLTQSQTLMHRRSFSLRRAVRRHTRALNELTPMDANGAPCFCLLALTHPPRTFPLVSFSCCWRRNAALIRELKEKKILTRVENLFIFFIIRLVYIGIAQKEKRRGILLGYPFSIL